jgi:hypothetical protein
MLYLAQPLTKISTVGKEVVAHVTYSIFCFLVYI